MTVNFPNVNRTTTGQEANRLARLMGMEGKPSVVEALRAELNATVRERPVRLDYADVSADQHVLARVCIITNDDGDEQFWTALNVAHPFVQNLINDMTPHQRAGAEVVLMTIHGVHSARDEATRRFYEIEANEWGRRLAIGTEILNQIFWPDGRPEVDELAEDEAVPVGGLASG